MSIFDLVLGTALVLIGVLFAAFAKSLLSAIDLGSPRAQYSRAVGSLVVGAGLLLAVPASNSPDLVAAFGTIALGGGAVYLLMPNRIWARVVHWFTEQHLTFYRVTTVVVTVLLGGFIAGNGLS